MEVKEIKRKDKFTWIVDGEELTTTEFVKKTCPSETIAKGIELWLGAIIHYSIEFIDSPAYGWEHFFWLSGIKEDPAEIEKWDTKYHVLLY